MMTLVENKITNRCAKSVYHSGEHVVTYTKTLCLFSLHQEHLSQWGPKPYTKTLCLFQCTKSIYHTGDQNLTLKPCLFHCTKSIYHNGDQNLTLELYVFFTAPRALILSQWVPKPCNLCLFYCTKSMYHNGDQNLTLKPYVFLRPTNWFVPELCRPSSCILCCPWTLCTHPIKDSDSSTGCPPEIQCLNNKMHF